MNQLPELQECFANGDVSLSIYTYYNPTRNVYRLKSGVAYLDFNESDLKSLMEILVELEHKHE